MSHVRYFQWNANKAFDTFTLLGSFPRRFSSQLRCIVKGVKEKTHTKDCNNDFSKVVKTTTTTDNDYPSLDEDMRLNNSPGFELSYKGRITLSKRWKAIQRISDINYYTIYRRGIYPVDGINQPSNNRGLLVKITPFIAKWRRRDGGNAPSNNCFWIFISMSFKREK